MWKVEGGKDGWQINMGEAVEPMLRGKERTSRSCSSQFLCKKSGLCSPAPTLILIIRNSLEYMKVLFEKA